MSIHNLMFKRANPALVMRAISVMVLVFMMFFGVFSTLVNAVETTEGIDVDVDLIDSEVENSATPYILFAARSIGNTSRTRIIMDFDRLIKFKTSLLGSPNRIVIDLPKVFFKLANSEAALQQGIIETFRYGAIGQNSSRIILNLKTPALIVEKQMQILESDNRFRVILDLESVPEDEFEAKLMGQASIEKELGSAKPKPAEVVTKLADKDRENILIVVDPGHGGIDSGAKGKNLGGNKVVEKDITLAFAKQLKEKLEKLDNVEVLLTRENDEFISLSNRVAFAEANQADLFISIHADSLREHYIRGASIYTLSKKASDELAARLAHGENQVDSLAGEALEPNIAAVNDILADLTSRETNIFSHNFARVIVKQFQGKIRLIKNPLRSAGFHVLKAPGVPSILLELGYLSNKEDEKLLINPKWQSKAANHLVEAVKKHLAEAKVMP